MDEALVAIPTRRLKPHEMGEIVARYNDLRQRGRNHKEACEEIAPSYDRSAHTINALVRRFMPNTQLAQRYLQASALRLAMRVVRKANVAEAIDVLSRKSVGVLSPKSEESGAGAGFFLSVQADSCGAVKVGVQMNPPAIASPTPEIIECNGYTEPETPTLSPVEEIDDNPHEFQGRIGKAAGRPEAEWSDKTRAALQAARNRIKRARVLAGRRTGGLPDRETDEGLQESHE
jgi:hypothetical protein